MHSLLAAAASGTVFAQNTLETAGAPAMPKIAVLCNAYQRGLHADVIVSKFILGFPTDEGLLKPKVRIASLYIEQGPEDCLGRELARRFDIPVYGTLEAALTLGGDRLAVDGVLFIGEHGTYPTDPLGRIMYPRMLTMKRVFRVFEASGRVAPVFSDKALAYNWLDAKWVYDRAAELRVPLMAGSVMPLSWRNPPEFDLPRGAEVSDAVVMYHGALDNYAEHGFELMQSLVERRKGGETGIRRIACVRDEDFDREAEAGRIPMDMVEAMLTQHAGTSLEKHPLAGTRRSRIAILVDYADGTRGTVLLLSPHYTLRWFGALRAGGRVTTCEFGYRPDELPSGVPDPIAVFSYQGLNIQKMFLTGKPQIPVERTLLASGVTVAAMQSLSRQEPIETPHLMVRYDPSGFEPMRPKGPHAAGASIEPWPPQLELRPLFERR